MELTQMTYRRVGKPENIRKRKDLANNHKGQAMKTARYLGLRGVHKEGDYWYPGDTREDLTKVLKEKRIISCQ